MFVTSPFSLLLLIFIIFFKSALILCSYWFCWLWACNRSYGRLTIRSLVLSWEDWQLTDLVPGRSVGACLIQMLNLNNLGQLIRPKLIIIVQFNVILWFVSFHILLLNVIGNILFLFTKMSVYNLKGSPAMVFFLMQTLKKLRAKQNAYLIKCTEILSGDKVTTAAYSLLWFWT